MKKFLILFNLILITGCSNQMTKATIETNKGTMEFELYDQAPITIQNFKKLANEGFYDGVRFHRVIKDFMIQTGDPLSKEVSNRDRWGTGSPGYTIKDEFSPNLKHDKKGILSMANSGPNTGGSQFFITLVPTPWLDNHHSVFGHLISGEEILDNIGSIQTNQQDQPIEDIIISKIKIN
jgi:cyclophilin family peptidyl-prolyl cis-trans isomerase